jgi:hypothetical protein
MTVPLLVMLLVAAQEPVADQAALRLTVFPHTAVRYGEPVRVTVDAKRAGFLTVLRVDTHGRVHVVFPLNPGDDTYVEAGEVTTLHDEREAFAAFERDGQGTVIAALADEPYDFGGYVSGGRWSYRLRGIRHAGSDHVGALLQLVAEVVRGDGFEHDHAGYWVTRLRRGRHAGHDGLATCYNGWHPDVHMQAAYDPSLDPFWYNPFLADDMFFDPYGCYGARLVSQRAPAAPDAPAPQRGGEPAVARRRATGV